MLIETFEQLINFGTGRQFSASKVRHCNKRQNVTEARLALAVATKTVIKNGLTILGVSAPEKM